MGRKSQEFNQEIIKNEMDKNKENECNQNPSNLLSVSFTTNKSDISMKSCSSNNRSISNLSRMSNKSSSSRNQLTTEELELQKLKLQKAELKKIKDSNAKHVARMNDDQYVFHPKRSTKLTIPISPAFATLKRAQIRKKSARQRRQSAVT